MKQSEIKAGMVVEANFYKYGTNVIRGTVNEVLSIPGMKNGKFVEDLPMVSITVNEVISGDQQYAGYTIGVQPEDIIKEVK